jgi:hypothetical protein
MTIEIGSTDGLTNTQYAPLMVMSAYYRKNQVLTPFTRVKIPMRRRDFTAADKLIQILMSILAGCQTLSEVNPKLRSELGLAKIWGWDRIADQSSLSRTLDRLTQKNIGELRKSVTQIRRGTSQMKGRDWRRYLWLDFDLSGLPCSSSAEASQKGYFSDKKTPLDGN